MIEIQKRKTYIAKKFGELYGDQPSVWTQAPGRVDLMGSHTDYNEGYVLTQAIELEKERHPGQAPDLQLRLAAHAYELEQGKPPASVKELVPDYLKSVPVDPATGAELPLN